MDKLKQENILYYQDCPGPLDAICKREDGQLKINVEGGHPPYVLEVANPDSSLWIDTLRNPDSLNWYAIESEIKFNDTLHILDKLGQETILLYEDCPYITPGEAVVESFYLSLDSKVIGDSLIVILDGNHPPYFVTVNGADESKFEKIFRDISGQFSVLYKDYDIKHGDRLLVVDAKEESRSMLIEIKRDVPKRKNIKPRLTTKFTGDYLHYEIEGGYAPYSLNINRIGSTIKIENWTLSKLKEGKIDLSKYRQTVPKQYTLILTDIKQNVTESDFKIPASEESVCTWIKMPCLEEAKKIDNFFIYAYKDSSWKSRKMKDETLYSKELLDCLCSNYTPILVNLDEVCEANTKLTVPTIYYRKARGNQISELTGFASADDLTEIACSSKSGKIVQINPSITKGYSFRLVTYSEEKKFDNMIKKILEYHANEFILAEKRGSKYIIYIGHKDSKEELNNYVKSVKALYQNSSNKNSKEIFNLFCDFPLPSFRILDLSKNTNVKPVKG